MSFQPPGSPELRAMIEPFVTQGSYPPTHGLDTETARSLNARVKGPLIELYELISKEAVIATGDLPKEDSPWAEIREQIRDKVWAILELSPELLALDDVQYQAIEKGAIPDPDKEESCMRYFRLPDWNFAHWKCGTPIKVKHVVRPVHYKDGPGRMVGGGEVQCSDVAYCPTCQEEPATHGDPVSV